VPEHAPAPNLDSDRLDSITHRGEVDIRKTDDLHALRGAPAKTCARGPTTSTRPRPGNQVTSVNPIAPNLVGLTYSALERASALVPRAALPARRQAGDRVAVALPNVPYFPVC
jgi:hypothetical protein